MKFTTAILFLLISLQGISQTYADKSYYLVDSLNLKELSGADREILDSCLKVYHNTKNDTNKINALNNICENMQSNSLYKYNQWIYDFAQKKLTSNPSKILKTKLLNAVANALNNMGYFYLEKGNIPKVLYFFQKSLRILQRIQDKKGMSSALNNIGYVYNRVGNIPEALKCYYKSLKIQEEINDNNGITYSLNNIGSLYYKQGDVSNALNYFQKGLEIQKQIDNKKGIARSLNNIGFIYGHQNNITKALKYYRESVKIREEIGDKRGMANSLINIGAIYLKKKNPSKALIFFQKSLKIQEKIGDKKGITKALINIGNAEFKQKNWSKSKEYVERGFVYAQKLGFPELIKNSAKLLSNLAIQQGNYKIALNMRNLEIQMRDSIVNKENDKVVAKTEAKYKYEKQKELDDARQEKKMAITREQKKKQKAIIYAISIGLLMVVISLYFVYNRLKITRRQKTIIERQKEIVEEKNKEITDSITYAKRIQNAILPPMKAVKEHLQQSFIIYKPKDIVAGDFYWMESVIGDRLRVMSDEQKDPTPSTQNSPLILFAAADCTGHGVPGAMVSVVCNNALNRSVREHGLTDPGEILNKSREIVIQEFEKSDEEVKDGMDIALCSLAFNKLCESSELSQSYATLQYAGANNPLWIITSSIEGRELEMGEKTPLKSPQGDKYLIEIKANKQPIGKFERPLPYTTHTFELQKGDTIYIFSDGYIDQFGGEKGKKLKAKAFRELLLSIQEKTMEEQKIIINQVFETWRGNEEQIDDVCVIGVRI